MLSEKCTEKPVLLHYHYYILVNYSPAIWNDYFRSFPQTPLQNYVQTCYIFYDLIVKGSLDSVVSGSKNFGLSNFKRMFEIIIYIIQRH